MLVPIKTTREGPPVILWDIWHHLRYLVSMWFFNVSILLFYVWTFFIFQFGLFSVFNFIFYYFRNYLYSTIPLISGSRYLGISGMCYIQFYSFVDIYYLWYRQIVDFSSVRNGYDVFIDYVNLALKWPEKPRLYFAF